MNINATNLLKEKEKGRKKHRHNRWYQNICQGLIFSFTIININLCGIERVFFCSRVTCQPTCRIGKKRWKNMKLRFYRILMVFSFSYFGFFTVCNQRNFMSTECWMFDGKFLWVSTTHILNSTKDISCSSSLLVSSSVCVALWKT